MLDDDSQQQQQHLNYKVNVDRSDVYQAISEIEQRAQQSAQAVSAMSSNVLNQIAQMQAGAVLNPNAGFAGAPANLMSQLNAMQAGMYANSTMPFSPQSLMAQDMYQQQIMAMGPSSGLGPAMTTPAGTPTINPFLTPAAPSYTLPTGSIQQLGAPGQLNEPGRSRLIFGTGEGSLFNVAFKTASRQLRPFFGGTDVGFANDNLEDPMYRAANRNAQYFAENIFDVGAGITNFAAGTAGGLAAGGVTRAAISGLGLGRLATAALPFGTGLAATFAYDTAVGAAEARITPYREAAKDLQDYISPYVRGSSLGGGFGYRDTLRLQRDLEKTVSRDNFFNAEDYRTLINMAGDTGMFQMTGSKEQALKAIENMSKSVKTLYALGVKSREQLQTLDAAFNQFGVSAGADPTRLANVFQTFASTAMSAGVSTAQMTQEVAPFAQAAMAQGLAPDSGAVMGAQNRGIAGAMFRQGSLGSFDNAYFGGPSGFGSALTSAQLSILRSPAGQALMAGMFAPGSQTLSSVMNYQGVSPMQGLTSIGGFANNPLRFSGVMARMPELTQNMGSQLQFQSIYQAIAEYRQLGLPTDEEGKIDPTDLLGFLQAKFGLPPDKALALIKSLENAPATAKDIRRSALEQESRSAAEGTRHITLGRYLEKQIEHAVDPALNAISLGGREMAIGAGDMLARGIGFVFGRDVQDLQELQTGVRAFDLRANDRAMLDPSARAAARSDAERLHARLGIALDPFRGAKPAPEVSRAQLRAIDQLDTAEGRRRLVDAMREAGVSGVTAEELIRRMKQGTTTTDQGVTEARAGSSAYNRVAERLGAGVTEDQRSLVERVSLDVFREQQEELSNVLSAAGQLDTNPEDARAVRALVQNDERLRDAVGVALADLDPAAARGFQGIEATGRAVVAARAADFDGKRYEEVIADPQAARRLGRYVGAIGQLATDDEARRNKEGLVGAVTRLFSTEDRRFEKAALVGQGVQELSKAVGSRGSAASIEELNQRLDSMKTKNWFKRFENSEFNHLLDGDKATASTALAGGMTAALATLAQRSGSAQGLLRELTRDGAMSQDEAASLMKRSGLYTTDRAAFQNRVEELSASAGRLATGDDPQFRKFIAEAQQGDLAANLARYDRAGTEIASYLNKTGLTLDDQQRRAIRERFGDKAPGMLQALEGKTVEGLRSVVDKLAPSDNVAAGQLNTLLDAIDSPDLTSAAKDAAAALELTDFAGSSRADRFNLIANKLAERTGGIAATEKAQVLAGIRDPETVQAQQAAIREQLMVADKFAELSRSLGKDGGFVQAVKDQIIGAEGKPGTVADVVKKFADAVEADVRNRSSRPAGTNTNAQRPLNLQQTPNG